MTQSIRDTRPATVGKRVHAARRMVQKWTTTNPPIPRAEREALAALLLAEDDDAEPACPPAGQQTLPGIDRAA